MKLRAITIMSAVSALTLASPLVSQTTWSAFPFDDTVSKNAEHVHDPTIIPFKGWYFCFSTSGDGFVVVRRSRDMRDWTTLGPIFANQPDWMAKRFSHKSVWAPDVVVLGDKLRVYYCASNFGTNDSVIGVAECDKFDPMHPLEGWRDLGLVLESVRGKDFYNAIDPEVTIDDQWRHWLFFGSYFAGIFVTELDPVTGKLKDPTAAPQIVARNTAERGNPLEGAAILKRNGQYYLFVSYGLAAQGVRSTYRIMVGRSTSPTGPFLDAKGTSMVDGGHVEVLKGSPPMFSPGHCDALQDDKGRWLMPYHFYDARKFWVKDTWGRPTLQVRELIWSTDGWPLPGLPLEAGKKANEPIQPENLIGKWTRQIDFGEPGTIEFRSNGIVIDGDKKGDWTLRGNQLTLRWPPDANGKRWTDNLTLAYGGRYFAGRNDEGTVLRGIREGV